MCVSAMEEQNLKNLERNFQAKSKLDVFEAIFRERLTDKQIKVSKALELNFEAPRSPAEQRIKDSIVEYRVRQTHELEQELFKQKKRLADAERKLKTKTTVKAQEDQRIATNKIDALVKRIAAVKRTEPVESDARIFPFYFVPLIVREGEENWIVPARYHCRPPGKPAFFDRKYPGLFNARRDNLEGFWKDLFGKRHGIIVVSSFYENVPLHKVEHRELRPGEAEQNVVLHFNPNPPRDMNVACLWSRIQASGRPDLLSFAAITDEPTPEVAATGHDRMIVTLKSEHVSAWLSPEHTSKDALYEMFDDRERPYLEHRRAA